MQTDKKFTPGPWNIDTFTPLKVRASGITDGNQIVVCDCSLQSYIHGCNLEIMNANKKLRRKEITPEQEQKTFVECREIRTMLERQQLANARLISAAPTMLEALKAIAPFVHDLQVENFNDLGAGIFENKELTDAHSLVFNAITKATGEKEDSNA